MSPGESTSKSEQPDLHKGNMQKKSHPSSQSAMEIKEIKEIDENKGLKEIKVKFTLHF